MRICLIVGHRILRNGNITSADGFINEYKYNKILVPEVSYLLRKEGCEVDVIQCPEYKFFDVKEEYNYKIPKVNKGNYDLVVEFHLNASNGQGYGVEVLHYDNGKGKQIAQRVQNKLNTIFRDRGIKQSKGLYILRDTNPTAILIESFFCDNENDCKIAYNNISRIPKLIAEGILGREIKNKEVIFDMDKIVLYFGDADLFSAILVSQKHKCPIMKKSDYQASNIKAKEIINIGGNQEDTDRFITMKNACKYL